MHFAIAYNINVKTHISIYIFHTFFELSNGFRCTFFKCASCTLPLLSCKCTYLYPFIYIHLFLVIERTWLHIYLYIHVHTSFCIIKTGLSFVQTNVRIQWNPVYKAFHRMLLVETNKVLRSNPNVILTWQTCGNR